MNKDKAIKTPEELQVGRRVFRVYGRTRDIEPLQITRAPLPYKDHPEKQGRSLLDDHLVFEALLLTEVEKRGPRMCFCGDSGIGMDSVNAIFATEEDAREAINSSRDTEDNSDLDDLDWPYADEDYYDDERDDDDED